MKRRTIYLDAFLRGLIAVKPFRRQWSTLHRQYLYDVQITRRGRDFGCINVNVPEYLLVYRTHKRAGCWRGIPVDRNVLAEVVQEQSHRIPKAWRDEEVA